MTEVEKNSLDIMWENTRAWYEWVDDCIKNNYYPYQRIDLDWNVIPWTRGWDFWAIGEKDDRNYFNKIFRDEIKPIIEENIDRFVSKDGLKTAVENLIASRYKDWHDNATRRGAKIIQHKANFNIKWPSNPKILEEGLFGKHSSMIWKEFTPNEGANRFTLKEECGVERKYTGDFWVEVDECTILCTKACIYINEKFRKYSKSFDSRKADNGKMFADMVNCVDTNLTERQNIEMAKENLSGKELDTYVKATHDVSDAGKLPTKGEQMVKGMGRLKEWVREHLDNFMNDICDNNWSAREFERQLRKDVEEEAIWIPEECKSLIRHIPSMMKEMGVSFMGR